MPPRTKKTDPAAPDVTAADTASTDADQNFNEDVDQELDAADPTAEELEAAATFGVTVEVLRAIRASAAADISAASVQRQDDGLDPQAPICPAHWPGGWPKGGDHADCEHGTWKR